MKILTSVICAGGLMASAVFAGNLEEPIMEAQVVAPSEAEMVTQDETVFDETAQADGGWLVPAMFLIFGAAVSIGN